MDDLNDNMNINLFRNMASRSDYDDIDYDDDQMVSRNPNPRLERGFNSQLDLESCASDISASIQQMRKGISRVRRKSLQKRRESLKKVDGSGTARKRTSFVMTLENKKKNGDIYGEDAIQMCLKVSEYFQKLSDNLCSVCSALETSSESTDSDNICDDNDQPVEVLREVVSHVPSVDEVFSDLVPLLNVVYERQELEEVIVSYLNRILLLAEVLGAMVDKVKKIREWTPLNDISFVTVLELLQRSSKEVQDLYLGNEVELREISNRLRQSWMALNYAEYLEKLKGKIDLMQLQTVAFEVLNLCPSSTDVDFSDLEAAFNKDSFVPPYATDHLKNLGKSVLPRSKQVDEIVNHLFESSDSIQTGPHITVVSSVSDADDDGKSESLGVQGVGKSSIAAMIARRKDIRHHFNGGVVWLTLGQDGKNMSYAAYCKHIKSICDQLRISEFPAFGELLLVPGDDEKIQALTMTTNMVDLKTTMKLHIEFENILIILDNVHDQSEIEWFNFDSPQSTTRNFKILVTSQVRTLNCDKMFEVGYLEKQEALELVKSGNDCEPNFADRILGRIIESIGDNTFYHPLTLVTISGYLRLQLAVPGDSFKADTFSQEVKKIVEQNKQKERYYKLTEYMFSYDLKGIPAKLIKICMISFFQIFCPDKSSNHKIPFSFVAVVWKKIIDLCSEYELLPEYGSVPCDDHTISLIGSLLADCCFVQYNRDQFHSDSFFKPYHHIHHDYAAVAATELEATGILTEDWLKKLNNSIVDYCYPNFDTCDTHESAYLYEMLPMHMLEAGQYDSLQEILANEKFLHGRLATVGLLSGIKMHIRDCENLVGNLDFDDSITGALTLSIYEEIISYLREKAVAVGEGQENELVLFDVIRSLHDIGFSYSMYHQLEQAINTYQFAKMLLQSALGTTHEFVAATLYILGVLFQFKDEHASAVDALKEALQIRLSDEDESHKDFIPSTRLKLGHSYLKTSNVRDALTCFCNLLQDIKESSSPILFIEQDEILHKIGDAHYNLCEYSNAIVQYQSALVSMRPLERSSQELASTYFKIGECHRELENNSEAIDNYNESIALRRESTSMEDEYFSDNLVTEGNIAAIKDDTSNALLFYTKALEIQKSKGESNGIQVASILDRIGVIYMKKDQYQDALTYFQESLEINTIKLGEEHREVASTLFNVGHCMILMEEYQSGLEYLKGALKIRKRILKDGHICVADTMHYIANIHEKMGDFQDAFKIYKKEYTFRINVYGHDDIRLSTVLRSQARVCLSRDDPRKAIKFLNESERINRLTNNSESLDLADIWYQTAVAYEQLGDYDTALKVINNCMRVRVQKLDYEHPMTAETLQKLGDIYAAKGEYSEASKNYEEVLSLRKFNMKQNNQDISCTLEKLGDLDRLRKQPSNALKRFEEALHWLELVEDDSLITAKISVLHKLGKIKAESGRLDEALETLEKTLILKKEENEKILNNTSNANNDEQEFADILLSIGVVNGLSGNHDVAFQYLTEVIEVYKKVSNDHEKIGEAYQNMGTFYASVGNCVKAIDCFEEALRIRQLEHTFFDEDVASILFNLAYSYSVVGSNVKAIECLQNCGEIRTKLFGEHDEKVADVLYSLGKIFMEMGEKDSAMDHFLDAYEMRKHALGVHEKVAMNLYWLGNLADEMRKYEKALEYFEECLLMRKSLKSDQLIVAETIRSMGYVYNSRRKYEEAMECFEDCLKIQQSVLPDDDQRVGDSLNILGVVKTKAGYSQEGIRTLWEALRVRKLNDDLEKVSDTLNNIGNVHKEREEYDLALNCYQESLMFRKKHLGGSHIKVADSNFNIGIVYDKMGNQEQALTCYKVALFIRTLKYGKDHDFVAIAHYKIAFTCFSIGPIKDEELFENMDQFIRIKRLKSSTKGAAYALALDLVAQAQRRKGNYKIALKTLGEALAAVTNDLGVPTDKATYASISRRIQEVEDEEPRTPWRKLKFSIKGS